MTSHQTMYNKVLKENTCQPKNPIYIHQSYPSKTDKMKTFPDKQPLRESVASRYPLQEIIEGILSLKANDLGW